MWCISSHWNPVRKKKKEDYHPHFACGTVVMEGPNHPCAGTSRHK